MLLTLHCGVLTAGDTVPDDGEYGLRILHQKWPHMMIDVMDLFMGVRAVINAQGRSISEWLEEGRGYESVPRREEREEGPYTVRYDMIDVR